MYQSHFGFAELPFSLTPNTSFYFGLPGHNEALEVLKTALAAGEGFIKVTGEVGTGKTLICRKLLNEMPPQSLSAYIPNPMLSAVELRRAVADELNVELGGDADQQIFTRRIEEKLIALALEGKQIVLVIDEAQALPEESIEALRLMTNLETESRKLLQVVLFGQPELDEKLAKQSLRQLRQRITFSYQLHHMNVDQIYQYIRHRVRVAGYQGQELFSVSCCKLLFRASGGTPRLVNVICHKALMLCYGEGKDKVSAKHVKLAAADTEASQRIESSVLVHPAWLLSACVIMTVAIAGAILWNQGGPL